MIANILILVFLITMAYWWGTQGLFSAFLHAVETYIAAALAVALWEPITLGMLIDRMPQYAWGVGLLAPFILILIVLRATERILVKTNMDFPILANVIGGGLCGLAAGVMAAGMTLLGLSFLPLPPEIAGYLPLVVNSDGTVTPNPSGILWVDVDKKAAGMLAAMSEGVFSVSEPMAVYQPDLATQAALFRLKADEWSSVSARPSSVQVADYALAPLATAELPSGTVNLLGRAAKPDCQLAIVETHWSVSAGTFDSDSTLRVFPTQVRLVCMVTAEGRRVAQLVAPVAASRVDPAVAGNILIPFTDDKARVAGGLQTEKINWVFVVQPGQEPRFILLRHTRLDLPAPHTPRPADLIEALGHAAAAAPAEAAEVLPGNIGERGGIRVGAIGTEILATNELPHLISKNRGTGLEYVGNFVSSGKQLVQPVNGPPGKASEVRGIFFPAHQAAIRVKLTKDQAQSLYGGAMAAAASLQVPILADSLGQTWAPTAYVWVKQNGDQEISVGELLESGRQIPVREMAQGDDIYLYYPVTRSPGLKITSFKMSNRTIQAVELSVP